MKLSMQWLNEYVDVHDVDPVELADRLTNAGVAVDAVVPRNQGVRGVVVGHVVTCEQHPNADRLHVCSVDVGEQEPRTIVCGAQNVAALQRVAVALPGSSLPGGKIGVAKLRGIESQGMICSAQELGLETRLMPKAQTDGILVLPADTPVGEDVAELLALGDTVLELDLTPNRSDCLSLRGLAYEVGALLDRPVRFDETGGEGQHRRDTRREADGEVPVCVEIGTPLCPRYEAQVIQNLTDAASPLWMQMRLLAMGVRPVSLVVDVTNYVMLEWGQPLHAFDLDQVRTHTIVVRQAEPGEQVVTLDGEVRTLTSDTIVIADPDRAIGIAGVMGGANSEVTPDTRQVVIESAVFDAPSVRRTGQRLGLRSEAQQRFEKGVDPAAVRGALVRAAALLEELAGAQAVGGVVAAGSTSDWGDSEVMFSPVRCNQLLGTELTEAAMRDVFRRLGLVVSSSGEPVKWRVSVPGRRPDLRMEADLVEEVGRLCGFDAIPSTLPAGATTAGVRNPGQRLRQATREVLLGLGLTEVYTYTFTHPDALLPLRLPQDAAIRQMILLLRPLSDERIALRTHLLPGLAEVAQHNLAHGVTGGQVFEIGRVYHAKSLPLAEQPLEPMQWAGLWFGVSEPEFGERSRPYDFADAKGVIEVWLQSIGFGARTQFEPAQPAWLHPGRAAAVKVDGQVVGTFGELHPETAEALKLGRALYAEFDLDLLLQLERPVLRVQALPRYPASRRDLAVLVDSGVPAQTLLEIARDTAARRKDELEECFVFDVYTGEGVPAGHKSVAIALIYRSSGHTLTDEQVDASVGAILERLRDRTGARLRSS